MLNVNRVTILNMGSAFLGTPVCDTALSSLAHPHTLVPSPCKVTDLYSSRISSVTPQQNHDINILCGVLGSSGLLPVGGAKAAGTTRDYKSAEEANAGDATMSCANFGVQEFAEFCYSIKGLRAGLSFEVSLQLVPSI